MTAHFLEGHARCLAIRESEISNFQEKVSMMLTILTGFCNNSSSEPLTLAEISNFQIYFRKPKWAEGNNDTMHIPWKVMQEVHLWENLKSVIFRNILEKVIMTLTIPNFPHGPARLLALIQAEISNFKVYLGELKSAEGHNPPIANYTNQGNIKFIVHPN